MRVLCVCTGNICRSPMAERLLRDRLGPPFEIVSAGTHGFAGEPMQPFALSTLSAYGVDGADFRARVLTEPLVLSADLVLTASREHRSAVVGLDPTAAPRTFTIREFARLSAAVGTAGADPVQRARSLVVAAAAVRGTVRAASPRDDDIADPYRRSAKRYAECAALLVESLAAPLAVLLSGEPRRPSAGIG